VRELQCAAKVSEGNASLGFEPILEAPTYCAAYPGLVLRHRRAFHEARIFFASMHTAMENRFIVKADDLLTAFLSLERDAIAQKDTNGNGTR